MTTADYIDWDEGRDFKDVTFSVAVLQCENCGRTGERLTRVPEFDYMGCDDCMEEALAVIESEQEPATPARFTVVERWTGQSWIEVRLEWNGTEYKESPLAGAKQCVNCKTQSARWDSIYCSDNCRRAFLTFPEVA